MKILWKVVLLLWTVLCVVKVLTFGNCLNIDENTDELLDNARNTEEVEPVNEDNDAVKTPFSQIRRLIDPQETWKAFLRHSELTNQKHRAKNAKRTKKLSGQRGPVGPAGPPGPPGPPGAQITQDVLIQEFRAIVKEAAERRLQIISDSLCKYCNTTKSGTGLYVPSLFDIDEALLLPKLIWGFHCRLEEELRIQKHASRIEITGFYVPFVQGGFQRGDGINPQEGRFTVSRAGIYNFLANLHIKHRSLRKRRMLKSGMSETQKIDIVRAMICINSQCLQKASLEAIIQLTPAPWKGSVVISGYLELQKDQYVSIYIDNSENDSLVVEDSSYFTGSLIGL